jgi:hypothetical protein
VLTDRLASFTSISGPGLDHLGHWLRDRARAGDYRVLAAQLARCWYIAAFMLPGAPQVWRLGLGRAWPWVLARVEGVRGQGDRTREGVHGMELYRANFGERLRRPRDRATTLPVQLVVPTRDHYVGAHLLDGAAPDAPIDRRRALGAARGARPARGVARRVGRRARGVVTAARPAGWPAPAATCRCAPTDRRPDRPTPDRSGAARPRSC